METNHRLNVLKMPNRPRKIYAYPYVFSAARLRNVFRRGFGASSRLFLCVRQLLKTLLDERRVLNAREAGVEAVHFQQFFMRAALDNLACA